MFNVGDYISRSGGNTIEDRVPRKYKNLRVEVILKNDGKLDITDNVSNIEILESISAKWLQGNLTLIDNSSAVSGSPFLGQEKIRISFQRLGLRVKQTFIVERLRNIEKINDTTQGVVIEFSSSSAMTNQTKRFSKKYEGLTSDMIAAIWKDHISEPIKVRSKGSTSHRIVFPWTVPSQAIDVILENTYAIDGSQFFLYERLFSKGCQLESLIDMMNKSPNGTLAQHTNVNKETNLGQGSRVMHESIGSLYNYYIQQTTDVMSLLANGSLRTDVERIDLSNKTYTELDFKYKEQAPTMKADSFDKFKIDDEELDSDLIRPTIKTEFLNTLAFEDSMTDVNTHIDDFALSKFSAYGSRLDEMIHIQVTCDSDPDTYRCGETIDFKVPLSAPALSSNEDMTDKLISGKYLITSVKHKLSRQDYTMTMMLSADGYDRTK